jgi:hypothetical protein
MLKSFEPAFHAMATMAAYHAIDGIPITADPILRKKTLREGWESTRPALIRFCTIFAVRPQVLPVSDSH